MLLCPPFLKYNFLFLLQRTIQEVAVVATTVMGVASGKEGVEATGVEGKVEEEEGDMEVEDLEVGVMGDGMAQGEDTDPWTGAPVGVDQEAVVGEVRVT